MTPHVIVAGAGPVGLSAALLLAMHGVPVLLLEKRDGLNAASRASTLHPPTLELLDRMGVLAPVAHEGRRAGTIQYRTPEGPFATLDLGVLAGETAFPYRLHLEQARITPVMLRRLRSFPHASVLFGAEARGIEQDEACVQLTVTHEGRERRFRAPHVIAADGARSVLREALGIPFPGAEYPHRVLRVMTTDDLDGLLPGIAPVTYLHHGGSSVSFLHMPECWRIILRVPAETTDEQALDEGWILARFRDALPAATRLPRVSGKDVYRASRRVADVFQRGRVLLAGDAAHVTNTRGGMNMNAGIADAAALADALATDEPGQIAAVAAERHRVASALLIPRTDRTVTGAGPFIETIRALAADPEATRGYLHAASMLDMLERSPLHA